MSAHVVLGLAYGDEGKGLTTARLAQRYARPLVVRFSGGHQAGHTVVDAAGRRHVSSNFGAGVLLGAPTYWSRHCTFYPIGFANERAALVELGCTPVLYADDLAPVTTPYDLLFNRQRETRERHGSCGLGFGATVARQAGPYKLHVLDLFDDFVLARRLEAVDYYYRHELGVRFDEARLSGLLETFGEAVTYCRRHLLRTCVRALRKELAAYDAVLFEGSQGLLLDREFGYFPHVTRAYVSSRNALRLGRELGLPEPDVHYVTRAYQTRHGNGPLTNEDREPPVLNPTPEETNVPNPWQGPQRRSLLDLDQLRYALRADAADSYGLRKHLVVTCLDQLAGPWRATDGGSPRTLESVDHLARFLGHDFASATGKATYALN